jgi:hypothetical protein
MLGHDVAAALPALRAQAESLMVDSCTITAPGTPVWDEDAGAYVPGAPTVLYSGRCRVQIPQSVPGAPVAGEAEWATSAVVVSVPVAGSEPVKVGATVTITSATHDAALDDAQFRVVGIPLAKSHATARRLRCEAVAR